MTPEKTEGSSIVLSRHNIGSASSLKDQDGAVVFPHPLKGFQSKLFQEPKRHSSEKIVRNRGGYSMYYPQPEPEDPFVAAPTSASQFYYSQLNSHPSGVSTPPPPGMPYYQPAPMQYQQQPTYGHYSTTTLPQTFVQGFQSLQLDDSQYPPGNPMPPPYYPAVYMGYPGYPSAQPMMPPQVPQRYYQSGPAKRKLQTRPSQFRPPSSTFIGGGGEFDHGEHNAENEEHIVAAIKEFEEHAGDTAALRGKVAELAVTQTGSRFLQKQLTKASPSFVTFVLQEVSMSQKNERID